MRKKFILWLSLLISFSVTFHSCRTDLEAIGIHNEEKSGEHIHQKISNNIFQKETFLSGVNDFKRTSNSLSGKSSVNSDYLKRFSIDESSIYKMDVNNIQTYALRAYNIFESAETVYNLVYRKNGNDIAFSIVKILPDGVVVPAYDSQKGIVTKIDNPQTARTCTDFYSVEIWHCKEGVSWSQCDKCSNCLSTSSGYTSYECGGSTGTSPGGWDGGGGGSGIYDPSGYTFDPNTPPTIEPSYVRAVRASNFFSQQTDQAKSWAVEHADIYCSILEYYLDHIPPTSPAPNSYYWDFANFSIQLFMQNPDLTWEQFYNQFINTPCQQIKTSTNDAKYKSDITTLEGKTNLSYENGYRLGTSQTGTQNQLLQNKPGTSQVDVKFFPNTFAIQHTHYDGMYPIFSPDDILQFNKWIVWAKGWNDIPTNTPKILLNNLTYTVVTSNGNYLMAFDGMDVVPLPAYTQKEYDNLNKSYMEDYLNQAISIGNVSGNMSFDMDKLEKEFLQFVKDKMNMTGFKLFKVSSEGNTEIYLENGNRKTKQCS